jgi:hypothetical protein
VEALEPILREEVRRREARRRQRQAAEQARRQRVPDNDHVWLTAREVTHILGLSPTRVAQLTARGSLPFTITRRKRWYRKDLIEIAARSREFRRRQAGGSQ